MERLVKGNTLLVGEGDFSFAVSMVEKVPSNKCTHIIATSLETSESAKKHQYAAKNIASLNEKGVTVRLDTDATQLHINPLTCDEKFSCIIFNFPHAGGKSNHKKNRKLLNDFFASAVQVLENEGQIMMTLCKGQGGTPADQPMRAWHDSWQVVSMAANSGLILTNIVPFKADEYRVYTSTGFRSLDKGFNTENALTHVFELAKPVKVPYSTCDLRVKLGDSIFLCRPYIYRKLLQIRCIYGNKDHPVHKLYETFIKCLTSAGIEIKNQGLQHPFKGPPAKESSCEDRFTSTGYHGHKLVNCDISDPNEIADDLSDLIDETEIKEVTEGVNGVSLDWNPFAFSGPVELEILRVKYGPACKTCEISLNQFPMSYFMTLAWPIPIGQNNVDGIKLHKDNLTKAMNEIIRKVTHVLDDMMVNSRRKIEITVNLEDDIQICTDNSERILHMADICIADKALNLSDCTSHNDMKIEQSIKIGDCKAKVLKDNAPKKHSFVMVDITFDLCKVACSIYNIENEKLLWSEDCRVLSQFYQLDLTHPSHYADPHSRISKKSKQDQIKSINDFEYTQNKSEISEDQPKDTVRSYEYQSKDFGIRLPSLYPMTFIHDMSFWENKDVPFCMLEYCDIIRDVAGDTVINVELIDTYNDPVTGKTSRCYRLTFQSVDKALSYDASWKLQSLIRLEVEKKMKICLR